MIKKKQELNEEYLKKEYFFPRGRDAFFKAMQLLKMDKKNKILLPSYIGLSQKEGSGVYDPIAKLGVGFEFYTLGDDLSADIKDFAEKIARNDITAALIIHYFGFCQNNFEVLINLCKKNGKFIIEDCAHAFNSFYKGKRLGSLGDFSFYSIHKFLATEEGGILTVNNNKFVISIKDSISEKTLQILYKSDIEKISKIRVVNYNYLKSKIDSVKGVHPFYSKLPEGITPINFPIIVEKKDRNEVYFELMKRRIETVSLYHTLIPHIKQKEYPRSHFISSHILNLPIHEDVTSKDMDIMLKELNDVIVG
jgi:dTDP-4-amino-4,6-dideoxygalactose transaminase